MHVDLPAPLAEDSLLLDAVEFPVGILSADWDVIATNHGWQAMFPGLGRGVNVIGWMATGREARTVFPEWELAFEHFLAWWIDGMTRRGRTHRDEQVAEECALVCPRFSVLWERAVHQTLYLHAMVHTPIRRPVNDCAEPWTFSTSIETHPFEALLPPDRRRTPTRLILWGLPAAE